MHGELAFLLACGAAFALWAWAVKGRETVDRTSSKVCRDLGLQRLDESVALRRLAFARREGGIEVRRLYTFEYSTNGSDRRVGEVCLHNAVAAWAHLEHPEGAIHIPLTRSA